VVFIHESITEMVLESPLMKEVARQMALLANRNDWLAKSNIWKVRSSIFSRAFLKRPIGVVDQSSIFRALLIKCLSTDKFEARTWGRT